MIVELGFAGVDWLVREVLKEAGDAVVLEPEDARDGGPRRGRGDRAAARPAPTRARVSRRDQIVMSADEVGGVPRRAARRDLRDQRPARLAAPDAALVRRPRRRDLGLDVRQVSEGAQPRARPAGDAPVEDGEQYQELRGVMIEAQTVIHRDTELVADVRRRAVRALRRRRDRAGVRSRRSARRRPSGSRSSSSPSGPRAGITASSAASTRPRPTAGRGPLAPARMETSRD